MRTLLLILATMALLAGGFAVYWALQPANLGQATTRPVARQASDVLSENDSTSVVRGGKDVWFKTFDDTGHITNQFRAEEFNPQKEGFVHVIKPEAHFFLKGGQWIRVIGDTGDVVAAKMSAASNSPFSTAGGGGGAGGAPSRGRLQDVRMQLYETLDAKTPTLDMDMNNVAFDNESFRIFTEGYTDASGKMIAADEVKVTVRGKYEFDGRGLTIRWNDHDRRLELLEIAHGERLVIKDSGALGTKMPGSASLGSALPAGLATNGWAMPTVPKNGLAKPLPIALASADSAAAAAGAIPATTRASESTLYSIFFFDNVQVVQAEETLATGNVIEIFYSMKDTPDAKPTTTPVPTPMTDVAAKQDEKKPAEETAKPPTATQPAKAVAAPQPVILYWTGKLRIVPATKASPVPMEPGDSVVTMHGAPVVLTRDKVRSTCASFAYRTSDGGAMLNGSDAFPQVEIQQFGNIERTGKPNLTLLSERVSYDPEKNMATLSGKSRAIFPSDETDKSAAPAQASWNREGVARFAEKDDETFIESLKLTGDVDVQHPKVMVQSQQLNLAFDPPAAKTGDEEKDKKLSKEPPIRLISADEKVHCVLLDDDGVETELSSDHLDLATVPDAAGKLYPKAVNASGDVRAKQQGKELHAGQLALLLKPVAPKGGADDKSKTPTLELVRMDAKTNVRVTMENGAVASGDTLVATPGPDGKPRIDLAGKPARVTNTDGTILTSGAINVPNSTEARTVGPGTLHAFVKGEEPNAKPREMDVTWTDSALMNLKLKENQVQVVGKVSVKMPEASPEGEQMTTANAARILITLVDQPADVVKRKDVKKGSEKSAKPQAANGALAGADVDIMNGKQVSQILLNQDVVVNSTLTAPDGTLLRQMQIDSSLLTYDLLKRGLIVPRPGRMIVRDHRPPAEKRKDDQAAGDKDGLDSQRGASAFKWTERLEYNGVQQWARMNGEVHVAYQPDDPKEAAVDLHSNEVVATFQEQKAVVAARANPADMQLPTVQLRMLRAEGDVVVTRAGNEMRAPRLTYDPVTHWIRAIGTEDTPATFAGSEPGSSKSAREVHWNSQTWKMKAVGVTGRAAATGR